MKISHILLLLILISLDAFSDTKTHKGKKKDSSKVTKKNRFVPNTKVLFSEVFLMSGSDNDSKKIIMFQEGDKIRIGKNIKNNFVNAVFLKGSKKYSGWVHVENIVLTPEITEIIMKHKTQDSSQQPEKLNSDLKERDERIIRLLEKTFIIPKTRTFINWNLQFGQQNLEKNTSDSTASNISLDFNLTYGISENINFLFNTGYLFYDKERISESGSIIRLKSKGFEDFRLGFKTRLLNQSDFVDLVFNFFWISGFMPSKIPIDGTNGDAGKGAHSFFSEFVIGRSFNLFSPYMVFSAKHVGKSSRHTVDDRYTEKINPNFHLGTEGGAEFPQFLPILLLNTYFSYKYTSRQTIFYVHESELEGGIGSTNRFSLGAKMFFYKGASTYIFDYWYTRFSEYDVLDISHFSSVTKRDSHNFTLGFRF